MAVRFIRRLVMITAAGALLLTVAGCQGGEPDRAASPTAESILTTSAVTDASERSAARIAFLEQRAAEDPLDVYSLNQIAIEHMQRARETGDVSALSRAEAALAQSLARQPDENYEAVALSASLAVTQHDFARGLDLARQAIALRRDAAYAYGAAGDAQLGLGQYEDAAASFTGMLEIEPSLSSESRLALLAQLHGRHDESHMRWESALSHAEGDGTPEHEAWVRAQLGALHFIEGDLGRAGEQYALSLDVLPGYVHALGGLGRVAAANGDLPTAIDRYSEAIAAVPLPEYVIALGEAYEAAGEDERAAEQYELVSAIEQLYAANGVSLDIQLVLFNGDHGRDLAANVRRAETLFAEAPSIQAADALAWARFRAGDVPGATAAIAEALRTGTRDLLTHFHAAAIALAAGNEDAARMHFLSIRDTNPAFSPRHAATIETALGTLGLSASATTEN